MSDCILCKIIKGEVPEYKFWENDDAIALLDITPKVPGHTLVIPKNHLDYIFDMEDDNLSALTNAAKKVSKILKDFTGKNRVCVIVEGFAVPHVHIHLIPADSPEEFMSPALPGDHQRLGELRDELKQFIG